MTEKKNFIKKLKFFDTKDCETQTFPLQTTKDHILTKEFHKIIEKYEETINKLTSLCNENFEKLQRKKLKILKLKSDLVSLNLENLEFSKQKMNESKKTEKFLKNFSNKTSFFTQPTSLSQSLKADKNLLLSRYDSIDKQLNLAISSFKQALISESSKKEKKNDFLLREKILIDR